MAFYFGGVMAGCVCLVPAAIYWIVLALVQSALQAIYQTALYLYARDGQVPAGFRSELIEGALS